MMKNRLLPDIIPAPRIALVTMLTEASTLIKGEIAAITDIFLKINAVVHEGLPNYLSVNNIGLR